MCSAFTRIGHSGLKFTPFCIIGKYGFLGSGSTYRSLEETASQKPVKYHFNVVSFFLFRSKQA
jgi:hypothetical protein